MAMWRSASSSILRRRLPQQRAASLIGTRSSELWTSQNHFNLIGRTMGRMTRRCGCRPLTSSRDKSNSANGGGGIDDYDDDDDEGWINPVRATTSHGTVGASDDSIPKTTPGTSQRIETILEVSRQVKEQERLDRALEETEQQAEALFQLSEEEQATLTDDEILERLEEVLRREEELEEEIFQKEFKREENRERNEKEALNHQQQQQQQQQLEGDDPQQVGPDWLRNRRAMLGQDEEDGSASSSPSVVPIIHHTLLEADEIKLLLEAHGGEDIVVIDDDPEAPRMGGAEGMIFCTGGSSSKGGKHNAPNTLINQSSYLISTLSRVLIDHMKDRKLHELDIAPSAKQNTTNRTATAAGRLYGSGFNSPSESWRIVDCGNYIVHVLDEATRWDLNLEDLWSGADPLWNLNVFDDDAVEDYCERYPVSESYNGTGSSSDTLWEEETFMDEAAMKKLERTRFGHTRRHKPVIPQSIKNQDRRIGRKKRREQRERDYFGSID